MSTSQSVGNLYVNPNPASSKPSSTTAHAQLELTSISAYNLPSGGFLSKKNPSFYVSVTNGVQTKTTPPTRSENSYVEWNTTSSGLITDASRHLQLSVLVKRKIGKDKIIGVVDIPTELLGSSSQTEHTFDLVVPQSAAQTRHRPYITVSARYIYSLTRTKPAGRKGPDARSTELLSQVDDALLSAEEAVDRFKVAPSSTVNVIGTSPDVIVKSTELYDLWQPVLTQIKWVVDVVDQIAKIHPYARIAWSVISVIPKAVISQAARDENVRKLFSTMKDAFAFASDADSLRERCQETKQVEILIRLLDQICECAHFIQAYANDTQFWKRIMKNITSRADDIIEGYRTALLELRGRFLDHAAITTEINVFRILDHTGSMSQMLEDHVRDVTLSELPYAEGVRFNPDKACLQGTRTEILDRIADWVMDPSSERVLMLYGQAGRGKSSIAHEIARRFNGMGRLCTSFIFVRGEDARREPYRFFPTLARDLSHRCPSFAASLARAMKGETSSWLGARDYGTLFKFLLLGPLKDLHFVGPLLIIIDALDETRDATSRTGFHSFLAQHLPELPSNFRIFITSRPEPNIQSAFVKMPSIRILDIDNIDHTDQDLKIYLEANLEPSIMDDYGSDLVRKAEGLFQWAAVACQYISEPPEGLTSQDCIEPLLRGSGPTNLDELYKTVLSRFDMTDARIRARFQSVMGLILAAFEPLSVDTLQRYIREGNNDRNDTVSLIVSRMGSLLSNVVSSGPVSVLHTSFRDFLTDESRSGDFYVNVGHHHTIFSSSCLSIMNSTLKFNMCGLQTSYLPNVEISGLQSRIAEYIPSYLTYACRFLQDHLAYTPFNRELFERLKAHFEEKFLFWLEALSLTGEMRLASMALSSMISWLDKADDSTIDSKINELRALIKDASSFVRYFGMPISHSAPHIYLSALPFMPRSSKLLKYYALKFPNTLIVKQGQLLNWPALEKAIHTTSEVYSIAFSPHSRSIDSRSIVAGLRNHTICIWDTTTGHMVGGPFEGHTSSVVSVAFSPDGQRIASGSADRTIRVCDTRTGELLASPFQGHTDAVRSVSFSPDGKQIASGSSDSTICVWDTKVGRLVAGPFQGHTEFVSSVAFSPNGQHIASGSADNTVRVWDATTGRLVAGPFKGHTKWVQSVAFSPDGQRIASSSWDTTVRIWDPSTGLMVAHLFQEHTEVVMSIAFSPDGQLLVSGSRDQTVRVWDARTGKIVGGPFKGHKRCINSVTFSPNGQQIASASDDQTVCLWDAKLGQIAADVSEDLTDSVTCISFSPDGQQIASGSREEVFVWDAGTGRMVAGPFKGHTSSVSSVIFSPDCQQIASGSYDKTIRVWDSGTGQTMAGPFDGHTSAISCLVFLPDG